MKKVIGKHFVNITDVRDLLESLWSGFISNEKLVLPPKTKRPWLAATFNADVNGGLYA